MSVSLLYPYCASGLSSCLGCSSCVFNFSCVPEMQALMLSIPKVHIPHIQLISSLQISLCPNFLRNWNSLENSSRGVAQPYLSCANGKKCAFPQINKFPKPFLWQQFTNLWGCMEAHQFLHFTKEWIILPFICHKHMCVFKWARRIESEYKLTHLENEACDKWKVANSLMPLSPGFPVYWGNHALIVYGMPHLGISSPSIWINSLDKLIHSPIQQTLIKRLMWLAVSKVTSKGPVSWY